MIPRKRVVPFGMVIRDDEWVIHDTVSLPDIPIHFGLYPIHRDQSAWRQHKDSLDKRVINWLNSHCSLREFGASRYKNNFTYWLNQPITQWLTTSRRRRKMAMHLYFVSNPDENGVEGEPMLGSAGKDPEDSWRMLAANRQRATGQEQNLEAIKRELTERGCVVHKYLVKPL